MWYLQLVNFRKQGRGLQMQCLGLQAVGDHPVGGSFVATKHT